MELLFLLGDDVALLVALGIGVVGTVLFVGWMLEELGKQASRPEETRRAAEPGHAAIIREEPDPVALEVQERPRLEEESERRIRQLHCRHQWAPVSPEGFPEIVSGWRCKLCDRRATHEERARDATMKAALKEESEKRLAKARDERAEHERETRARLDSESRERWTRWLESEEGLRYTRTLAVAVEFGDDWRAEERRLQHVRELNEFDGTPISAEDATKIALFETLGEPVLTSRESLFGTDHPQEDSSDKGAREAQDENRPSDSGKLICVFSLGLGVDGKTFLSVNTAVALAEMTGCDVAIVDLDFDMGDVFAYFGREASASTTDLMELGEGVDADCVRSVGVEVAPHTWAFGATPDPAAQTPAGDAVRMFLRTIRSEFDYVIVDASHIYSESALVCCQLADLSLLVVSGLNSVGLKDVAKNLDSLSSAGVPRQRVRLALNRVDERTVALTTEDASKFLRLKLSGVIPSSQLVTHSLLEGTPLVSSQPESGIAGSLSELAASLLGEWRHPGARAGL